MADIEIDYLGSIKEICNKKMIELGLFGNETYERKLNKEYKDLEDWVAYGGLNMAKRLFELKNQKAQPINTNKSGSLCLFLLGISTIDPIKENIQQDIISLTTGDTPDIDTDFDPRYREWVKKNIVKLFGEEKTCSIGTYQTYKTRAVIVDVARALGLDVNEAMEVTKQMNPLSKHENEEGEEEKIDDMDWDEIYAIYPELKVYLTKYPEVLKHCKVLRNQVKNMSKHAGGMIISNLNLQDKIPVIRDKSGLIVSSWCEGQATHELSEVGLVKFDILGLSNLTIISDCVNLIKETKGKNLTKKDIPINDRHAIKFGCKSDLIGIFQFESSDTKPIVDATGVDSLEDISAVTSLLRPGPKDVGLHMEYAERKNGKEYSMPKCLECVLKETYGIIVYQESVMKVAQVIAGFTPVEANKLRSVISKKKLDQLPKMKEKFIKGSQSKIDSGEITKEEVIALWDILQSFGGYGFNKSHAVSYSAVTAAELWLKFNYPTQYMTALLNNTKISEKKHNKEILPKYVMHCRANNINVLSPDINLSYVKFHVPKDRTIRYALGHIRNVGKCAKEIIGPLNSVNAEGIEITIELRPYSNFTDFFTKINKRKVNSKIIKNLIYAGCFDQFGKELCLKAGFSSDEIDISDMRNAIQIEYHHLRYASKIKRAEKPKKEKVIKPPQQFTEMEYLKKQKKIKPIVLEGFSIDNYCSFMDFLEKTDTKIVKKNIIKNMIITGIFDCFGKKLILEQEMIQKSDPSLADCEKSMDIPIGIIRNRLFVEYHTFFNRPKIRKERKRKPIPPPENFNVKQYLEKENEVLGIVLSTTVLLEMPGCRELVAEQGWALIEQANYRGECHIFGRIDEIEKVKTKTGKRMLRVTLSDDVSEIVIFVFDSGIHQFTSICKKDMIAAIPTKAFDKSTQRFYNDRKDIVKADSLLKKMNK